MDCTIACIPRKTPEIEKFYNMPTEYIVGLTYPFMSLCKKDLENLLSVIEEFEKNHYDGPFTITFSPETISIEHHRGYNGAVKISPPSKIAGPEDKMIEYFPEFN